MNKPAYIEKRENLLKFLCLSRAQFDKMIKAGCPGKIKGHGYNLIAVCEWIYKHPPKRIGDSKDECLEIVREILARNQADLNTFNEVIGKNKPAPNASPDKKPAKQSAGRHARAEEPAQPKDRLELDEALEATKIYMQKLKEQIDANSQDTGRLSGDDLANWSKTLLALNEAAKKTTKSLSEHRKLVRIDAVQDYLAGMLSTLRSIFLNLPVKLAPVLENQTSGKIQKLLDEEIRNALEYARNYD